MDSCPRGVYRPRNPGKTGFHRLVEEHYQEFERVYPERYERVFGRLRPAVGKVVRKYLACGDLKRGFARVRCPGCGHEYLLAYSCKGRYFCTSCHTKRAAVFAERLNQTVLRPVPHRQVVFTLPKLLRVHFRNDRRLLGDLCRLAAGVVTEGIRALPRPGQRTWAKPRLRSPQVRYLHARGVREAGIGGKSRATRDVPDADGNCSSRAVQ